MYSGKFQEISRKRLKISLDHELILVTGASGFVGRAVFTQLESQQRNVVGLTRPGFDRAVARNDQRINGLAPENWQAFVADLKPTSIVLCDWEGVAPPKRDDPRIQSANLERWKSIVDAASPSLQHLIALGSQAELPTVQTAIRSDAEMSPRGTYGESKVQAYGQLRQMAEQQDFLFSWARIFSLYGNPRDQNWLIPKLLNAIKTKQPLDLTPSTQNWNFLHISDLVSALMMLLDKRNLAGPINIAHDKSHKVIDVVEYLSRKASCGTLFQIGAIPFSPEQVMDMTPDISEMLDIGWKPKIDIFDYLNAQMELIADD